MEDILENLIDILANLQKERRSRIKTSTRLREDLGIDGDDWDSLVQEIGKRWKVDWTSFNFYTYFNEELNLHGIYVAFKNILAGRKLQSLTVGHLATVITKGAWFDYSNAAG